MFSFCQPPSPHCSPFFGWCCQTHGSIFPLGNWFTILSCPPGLMKPLNLWMDFNDNHRKPLAFHRETSKDLQHHLKSSPNHFIWGRGSRFFRFGGFPKPSNLLGGSFINLVSSLRDRVWTCDTHFHLRTRFSSDSMLIYKNSHIWTALWGLQCEGGPIKIESLIVVALWAFPSG